MEKILKALWSLALSLAMPFAGHTVAAETSYPVRPVEMVVGWPAGGGTDVVARVYAEAAKDHFPQPILIVNKSGAIGTIGMSYVSNAPADGYKILMATPESLMAPLLGIGKASADQFIPVARINADPNAITVRADSPWQTAQQFLAYSKANPGKVTISTSGNGGMPDIAAIALEEATGAKFSRIPYQGNAPAIQAIVAGQVDATTIDPGSLSNYVKAGQLRILAVTAEKRLPQFDTAPTFREGGIDVVVGTWRGLLLPKGTPPEVVKAWADLTRKVSSEPKYQEALKKQNINVIYEDSKTFATVLAENGTSFQRLAPIIKASNK